MSKLLRVTLLVICMFCLGCSGVSSSISASSSPLPEGVRGTKPAHGSDCEYTLFGLIPITPAINTQKALQNAKDDVGVDVLTDITVDLVSGYFVIITNDCVHVRGLGVPKSITDNF